MRTAAKGDGGLESRRVPEPLASLTVLGCSPAWENSGCACSSYLVETDQERVLLDCGNGGFARLRATVDFGAVDAIVISHTHGDHMLDLLPFAYALLYSPRALETPLQRPRLLLPPGAADTVRQIFDLIDRAELLDQAYAVETYDPASAATVGSLTLTFAPVPHFIETYAIGVQTAAGGRLVYGADHRPCEEIVEFARGADVALIEATLQHPEPQVRGHMTAGEAGEVGAAAGVGALHLVHVPDELIGAAGLAEARRAYAAATFAAPGDVYRF